MIFIFIFVPEKENNDEDNNQEKLQISKNEISNILKDMPESEITNKYFTSRFKDEVIVFHTTINKKLQKYLESEINTALNSGYASPETIAFVVINPDTGEIKGMKGYNSIPDKNISPCTKNLYPAASIFKIITAAAAIESQGYSPEQRLFFNGGKYTLYKRQLSQNKSRYTNYLRLTDAFAQSVNPVFGKLGYHALKKDKLLKYSDNFSFNSAIPSDIFVKSSILEITDSNYNWAEIASGFNNTTKISVLHAAMINAAVVNSGTLSTPFLIEKIVDDKKNIRYKNVKSSTSAIKESTAEEVSAMMQRTVRYGTAKRAFNDYRRGKSMKNLIIGGKTGSISNMTNTVRYDWFTGFAQEKDTKESIAFAVLVGHGDYMGIRAAEYGRRLISNYFNNLS
ncbi:MAG: penicillin-binding transpeptidase domain-containing protein [Thermodesulfobacteriota bacterium]